MKFISRTTALIILFSFLGLSLPVLLPPRSGSSLYSHLIPRAGAAVPSFETNPEFLAMASVESEATVSMQIQQIYEWAELFLLSALKKRLLDAIVDQIIQWIQGGGQPKFLTDWDGFLTGAAQAAAGDFISNSDISFLCHPFQFDLKNALKIGIPTGPKVEFYQKTKCTLDSVIANINDFYDDFRNGAWEALAQSIKPQNNFLGVYLNASIIVDTEAGKARLSALNEGLSGSGFLSTKDDCKFDSEGREIPGSCTITTPGRVAGDAVAEAIGSDIKYIVNSTQLADYVSAIADAAINRMVGAGVKGLLGISTRNAPEGGVFSGEGLCDDLPPELQEQCREYTETQESGVDGAIQSVLDELYQSLEPRELADEQYTRALTELADYDAFLDGRRTALDSFNNITGEQVEDDIGDPPYNYLEDTIPPIHETDCEAVPQGSDCACKKPVIRGIKRFIDDERAWATGSETDFINEKKAENIDTTPPEPNIGLGNDNGDCSIDDDYIEGLREAECILLELQTSDEDSGTKHATLVAVANKIRYLLNPDEAARVRDEAIAIHEVDVKDSIEENVAQLKDGMNTCQGL